MFSRRYLLTGAGFSRNWGGWLADEAFEYLIGCPQASSPIRDELWKYRKEGGFEATLQSLRDDALENGDEASAANARLFEDMLGGMFNAMNIGFQKVNFNPLHDPHKVGPQEDFVTLFLAQFDAIFTLNQDCLLELKYNSRDIVTLSQGRWRDLYSPGLREVLVNGTPYAAPGVYEPYSKTYELTQHRQPYFKLHGSSNWRSGDASFLIMGGNKAPDIDGIFLLRSYRDRFIHLTGADDVLLVIVGYSFRDAHINEIIERATENGARLFIMDLQGIDALDNAPAPPGISKPFRERLRHSIVGASRRSLISTMSTDHVEFQKIMKFVRA